MELCANGSLFDFLYDNRSSKNNTASSWWYSDGYTTNSKFSSKRSSNFSTTESARESQVEMSNIKSELRGTKSFKSGGRFEPERSSDVLESNSSAKPFPFPSFKTIFERRAQSLTRGGGLDELRNREAIHDRPSADEYSDLLNYEMMLDAVNVSG